MSVQLWAIDAGGGQACLVQDNTRWLLVSADSGWRPLDLRGPEDAARWSLLVPALQREEIFDTLDEAIRAVRIECRIARSPSPPSVVDAVRAWPGRLFAANDVWSSEDCHTEYFWAYWLELASRASPPWEPFSGRLKYEQRRQAAFATHTVLCSLWRQPDQDHEIAHQPVESEWWAEEDRDLLVNWRFTSLVWALQGWLQAAEDRRRTTRELCSAWDKFDAAFRTTVLPAIDALPLRMDPASADSHTALSGAIREIMLIEPLQQDWSDIASRQAETLRTSQQSPKRAPDMRRQNAIDFFQMFLDDRQHAVDLLRSVYSYFKPGADWASQVANVRQEGGRSLANAGILGRNDLGTVELHVGQPKGSGSDVTGLQHYETGLLEARVRGGDKAALGVLLQREYETLVRYVRRTLRKARQPSLRGLDAEDIVQNTVVSALTRIDSFQGAVTFRHWLLSIAGIQIGETSHGVLVRSSQTLSRVGLQVADEVQQAATAPTADEDRWILQIEFRSMFAQLTPLERTVAIMYWSDGWSSREIAARLRMSTASVLTHLVAVRRRLREWYKDATEPE